MSGNIVLVVTMLFSCTTAISARDLSIDAVSEIHASRNGKNIALLSRYHEGAVIHVLSRDADRVRSTFALMESALNKYFDEAIISSIEWSPSGRWLKIEVNDGDVDQAVLVLDVTRGLESLQEVKAAGRSAASASWSTSRDRLYLATRLEDEFKPASDDGVYVIEFPDLKPRHLTKGVAISARLAVTDEVAITKLRQIEGDSVRHVLVTIDLTSGSVKRLVP